MNKRVLTFIFILFLLPGLVTGCNNKLSPDQNNNAPTSTLVPLTSIVTQITATTPENLTNIIKTATALPSGKLQLTFIEWKDDLTEFYGMDVDCVENEQLCFGEPTLLFKTLPSSSNNRNQPMGRIDDYSWSPEGNKIVISANEDLFIGDMNTQEWNNVTNSPDVEEYDPQWSPDGRYIYYLLCTQDEAGIGSCKLAQLDLVENTNIFLLNSLEVSVDTYSVSPDNQNVVFSVPHGFSRLYQSNLDGSNVKELTVTDSEEISPSFSADGRLVAFVRDNRSTMDAVSTLESDIILQDSNWGHEKNLTAEFDGEALSPAFSFDGKWIAFERYFNIYVVSIDEGVVLPVTQGIEHKVFPSWRFFYQNQ